MTRSEHVADNSFPSCGSTVVIRSILGKYLSTIDSASLAFSAAEFVWVGMIVRDD
jgi:hypothetical protein